MLVHRSILSTRREFLPQTSRYLWPVLFEDLPQRAPIGPDSFLVPDIPLSRPSIAGGNRQRRSALYQNSVDTNDSLCSEPIVHRPPLVRLWDRPRALALVRAERAHPRNLVKAPTASLHSPLESPRVASLRSPLPTVLCFDSFCEAIEECLASSPAFTIPDSCPSLRQAGEGSRVLFCTKGKTRGTSMK